MRKRKHKRNDLMAVLRINLNDYLKNTNVVYFYFHLMKCAYCGTSIYTPFTCKDENASIKPFCDMLCGRLYDITNSPVQPLMKQYNQLYIKNRLSLSARIIFERLNDYILFKMIPICEMKETPLDTKRYYNQLFGI